MKKNSNHRYYVTSYDKYILYTYLALTVSGLLIMLDISSARGSMYYFSRQLIYAVASVLGVFFITYRMNFTKLRPLTMLWVGISVFLLILVLLVGTETKGATRSINLGIVNFQPSFLARIALIFYFAHVMEKKQQLLQQGTLQELGKELLPLIVITGLIYGLVLKGQHLSSLIISAGTLVCMMFLGGLRTKIVMGAVIIALVLGVVVIKMGASYRGERLDIYKKYCLFFHDKSINVPGEKEYQVKESLTALSSGRLFGTGVDRGRAKQYYLPEARTDYVFTVIGEEFGFLGALFIFLLHSFLYYRIMIMSYNYRDKDRYLAFLGMGLGLNIYLNVLVNVGVSMSILPSTGNTLPFISYSGTAMLLDSATIGVLLSISATRKMI